MKRVLSLLLAVIICTLVVVPFTVTAKEKDTAETGYNLLDENQFSKKINELKGMFPEKSRPDYTYYENGRALAWTCHGFANKLAYYCFGSSMYTGGGGWAKSWDSSSFNAGDIVRVNNDGHTIFITYVDGNTIKYAEGNYSDDKKGYYSAVRWDVTTSLSSLQSKFTYKVHLEGNNLTGGGIMYLASVNKGQDGMYMTDENVAISVNANNFDSCKLYIYHTPKGGSTYKFWEGNLSSNSYTRKFDSIGYYSCYFLITHGGSSYQSEWVGWSVVPAYHARTNKGAEGTYAPGEDVVIDIDNYNYESATLHIIYTPKGGTTSDYLKQSVNYEPVTLQFDKEGHYSCCYNVKYNGMSIESKWVGWNVTSDFQAVIDKEQGANYMPGEDVIIDINNHNYDTATLHIIYTPKGGTTVDYLNREVSKEPVTLQFDKDGHYACCYYVTRNGQTYESKWIGWNIVSDYCAVTNKGTEGSFEPGEDVIIDINSHYYDSATLHIIYTPKGGTTVDYLNRDVSKEPVTLQFDKEGHYSCCYYVKRNGQTYESKWVGWNVYDYSDLTPVKSAEQNSHRYEVFETKTTWQRAKLECERRGGHLAVINSAEENELLTNISNGLTECVWIGGTDEEFEGTWSWINGEDFLYSNWHSGEPDNADGTEHYLQLIINENGKGQWFDSANFSSVVSGFICEYEPVPTEPPTEAPKIKLGDADGDETVSIFDATVIQRKVASIPVATYVAAAADVDGDGDVTVVDATTIQRYLAGLDSPKNIGELI